MARNAVAFEVNGYEDPRSREAGAYWFMRREGGDQPVGIMHACPCGCGQYGAMWFRGGSIGGGSFEWDVAGEWPKVTMSPSIGFMKNKATGQYHWHGYLRNGVFEEC